jgi:Ca2+-binding RTX toxin-like protein
LGTDKADKLYGGEGNDKIRGLSANDDIAGGVGNDVIDAAPGDDVFLWDGNDFIDVSKDGQPDKFYCGKGKDEYGLAKHTQMDKNDYVDSSCEKKVKIQGVA